jgi:hypothetical protein
MFSPSAAGTLKKALSLAGRPDEVLCLFDDFSFGPIATEAAEDRIEWVERELGCTDWEEITDGSQAFLASFASVTNPVTVWLSRREAKTYAGFLWWLDHVEDLPISIIEVAQLSSTSAEGLVEHLDRAVPYQAEDRARDRERWQRLKAENAPFRVIDGDDLVSAPIDYFDEFLLRYATHEWQRMVKIVVGPLVEFHNAGVSQVGDLVLAVRLADLAEEGRLDWRGDFPHMHRCELRLPPRSR